MKTKLPFLFALAWLGLTAAPEPLRLVVPEYPPYTTCKEGHAAGLGVEQVSALLDGLGLSYRISGASYDRAIELIKEGQADGFFLASQNNVRDQVAILYAPIVYNTWNWYFTADAKYDPAQEAFARTVVVGSISGSNPAAWLAQHEFHVRLVPEATELPGMLVNHKGITAIMGPEFVINEAISRAGFTPAQFRVVQADRKPFGLYLAKTWVNQHPAEAARLKAAVAALKP